MCSLARVAQTERVVFLELTILEARSTRSRCEQGLSLLFFFFFFLSFCPFRAAPAAYGGSQAGGQMRAIATGLHHSHSNTNSKPRLQPTPQLTQHQILDPLGKSRDQTCVLMDNSQKFVSTEL